MPRLARYDFSPRLEMMPLLDVVFLLLTFFIYSFVVMIRADAVSVGLAPVASGSAPTAGQIQLLTIDGQGGFAYDGRSLGGAEVDRLLADLAADPQRPTLYVSLAGEGDTDRGPVVWSFLQRAEAAGLEDLVFVGSPAGGAGGGEATGE